MNSDWLALIVGLSIVSFIVWRSWRYEWRLPLNHGERYFHGVEVPEGWHASEEGKKWWRWYRISIIAPLTLQVAVFLGIVLFGKWSQIPIIALIAPVWVALRLGFLALWRRSRGANRRKPQRVAVALEERRLSQYFSWRFEALILALVALSWAALLTRGDAAVQWRSPITVTYVVLAFTALKPGVIRRGWPLPAERTHDYQRLHEIRRREAVRWFDRVRGFLIAVLAGYAALHSAGGLVAIEPLRWVTLAVALALGVWMTAGIVRWHTVVEPAEAGLPPVQMPMIWRAGSWWGYGAFLAGLAVLLVWPW